MSSEPVVRSSTLLWLFFFVLNRTVVRGREHVGDARNTILLANHQSMIDSFLIGLAVYYPKSLIKPHLLDHRVVCLRHDPSPARHRADQARRL